MINPVETMEIAAWSAAATATSAEHTARLLESGKVLLLPRLEFKLMPDERELLTPTCADGRAKNISFDPATRNLRGSALSGDPQTALTGMVERFYNQARQLVETLLPGYKAQLKNGMTSYRPLETEGRQTSVTKDDTLLHVDAFASRPNQGLRILRVFCNINPDGKPRVWEIGEPFDDIVAHYSPYITRQPPGSAWLFEMLHITKGRRSEYDHIMLNLHDRMKRDTAYQHSAQRVRVEFPAGSTWACFSDCVAHAALSGQYLLEQTFYLPVASMQDESCAPLRVLERRFQRKLA